MRRDIDYLDYFYTTEEGVDIIYDFEKFRPIYGCRNYYIGEFGHVMSIMKGEPIFLKTWPNQYGHQYVGLIDDEGVKRRESVHRLVAEAFLSNPKNYNVVRHLDDDPTNNEVNNLTWGTQADNVKDCIEHDRIYRVPVYCYELDRTFISEKEAAEFIGAHKSAITQCCKGACHSVKGMHFCYLNDRKDNASYLKAGNFKRVRAINVDTGEERVFFSRNEASENLGMNSSGISNVIAKRVPHVKRWRFEDVEECYD